MKGLYMITIVKERRLSLTEKKPFIATALSDTQVWYIVDGKEPKILMLKQS